MRRDLDIWIMHLARLQLYLTDRVILCVVTVEHNRRSVQAGWTAQLRSLVGLIHQSNPIVCVSDVEHVHALCDAPSWRLQCPISWCTAPRANNNVPVSP